MRLDNFEVQSCCSFISLRTGSKIFGFVSLLGCIVAIFLSVWELIVIARLYEEISIYLTLDSIAQTVQLIASFFLLLGAYQEKPNLIFPWLVSTVISAVLEVVFMPSLVMRCIGIHARTFIHWLIFSIFFLVDDIYGLLVVFSYYRSLSPQGSDNLV